VLRVGYTKYKLGSNCLIPWTDLPIRYIGAN